jgi:hypothetical protein
MLALAGAVGFSLTAAGAHADVPSRCDGLAKDWKAAVDRKGDRSQIARLRAQIEQKRPSCPSLWAQVNAYRPPVAEKIVNSRPQPPHVPPSPASVKMDACLVDIVKQASTVAEKAYAVEVEARKAAKEGEDHARAEKAAHPGHPSAPAAGKWTYADGTTGAFWGDTVANNTPSGYGVLEYSSDSRNVGFFQNGNPNGFGLFKYKYGVMYSAFRDGQTVGPGVLDFGDTRHAKMMDANTSNKYVVVTFTDGSTFKGKIAADAKLETPGVMYNKAGEVVGFGIYSNYTYFLRKITNPDCTG